MCGLALKMSHPEIPSCGDCQKYNYDPKTWKQYKGHDGQPIKRHPSNKTPCHLCPKIPKGKDPIPANAVELSAKNEQAIWYFWQCESGHPDVVSRDEITVRNNAIIKMLMDQQQRAAMGVLQALPSLMLFKG